MRHIVLILTICLLLAAATPAAAEGPLVHVVQPGDTLAAIAKRYQTSADAIARLNGLTNPDALRAGQKLTILTADEGEVGAADTTAPRVGPRRDGVPQPVHIVVSGDTLSRIAGRYDTTVDTLVRLNGLSSSQFISIGQRILLPVPEGPPSLAGNRTATYSVRRNDTLSSIAFRYGMDMRSIAVVNHLPAADWIWEGQQIELPLAWKLKDAPTPALTKRIEVDISEQHVYAWEGPHLVYSFVASTGLPTHPTRRGRFTIQTKMPMAVSTGLNLDMPHWMGIYYAGSTENGFHALPINRSTRNKLWGGFIGRPISYGCIVLVDKDAATLYDWAEMGTVVDIHD